MQRSNREVLPADDRLVDATENLVVGCHLQAHASAQLHPAVSSLRKRLCSAEVATIATRRDTRDKIAQKILAIKIKNNGKLPKGYKRARKIAYEK